MIGPYLRGPEFHLLVKESDERMKNSDAFAKMHAMNAMIGIVELVEQHRDVMEAAGVEVKAHNARVDRWVRMLHPRTRKRYEDLKLIESNQRQLAKYSKLATFATFRSK